jgi:hypothetical protein
MLQEVVDSQGMMAGLDEADTYVDVTGADDVVETLRRNATTATNLSEFLNGAAVMGVVTGRTDGPHNDYEPDWFALAHPSVFPHGVGLKPDGMSTKEWVKCMLNRWPRAAATNVPFILHAFNIIMRHDVNAQAGVQMRLTPAAMRQVGRMNQDSVAAAISLAKLNLPAAKLRKALEAAGPTVKTLWRAVSQTRPRVFGSGASFRSFKSKTFALHYAVGEWTMMLNLNPSELHADLVFHLAGRAYTVVDGRPDDLRPNVYQRWVTIAGDIMAVASFFDLFIRAFSATFLNWDMTTHTQSSPDCLFGLVTALVWKYENASRGGKHFHGLPAQPANAIQEVIRRLQSGDMRRIMTDFWSDYLCAYLPSPYYAPQLNYDGFTLNSATVVDQPPPSVVLECAATGTQPVLLTKRPDGFLTTECRALLRDEAEDMLFIARAAAECAHHGHTATCEKTKKRDGYIDPDTERPCRMVYSRPLVRGFQLEESTGAILMRRDYKYLVPYSPSFMLAFPCNHTFSLFCEQSRWFAEYMGHRQLVRQGKTVAAPPIMPRPTDTACSTVCYSAKYIGKENEAGVVEKAVVTLERLVAARQLGDLGATDDDLTNGKTFVAKIANAMHGAQVYTAVLAVSYLLGHGDYYISHDTVSLDPRPFADWLLPPEAGEGEAVRYAPASREGPQRWVNALTDWRCRPTELKHLPPYFFVMTHKKAPKDKFLDDGKGDGRRTARYKLAPEHPQAETDMVMELTRMAIPQPIREIPRRPPSDGTAEAKAKYAAFVLALFSTACDGEVRTDEDSDGLWPEFLEWEENALRAFREAEGEGGTPQQAAYDAVEAMQAELATWSLNILWRMDGMARSFGRDKDSAATVRRERAAAADGLVADLLGSDGESLDGNNSDAGADEGEMVEANWNVGGANLESIMHAALHHTVAADVGEGSANERFMRDGLAGLPAPDWSSATMGSTGSGMRVASPSDLLDLDTAYEATKQYNTPDATPANAADLRLELRVGGGTWAAQLLLMDADDVGHPTDHATWTDTPDMPMFVKLRTGDPPPTPRQTSDLFGLSDDQRIPFAAMAVTLEAEVLHQRNPSTVAPPDQLLMTLCGMPGAGKSRVILAFLWHAFQHDASDMIAIVSYTWRAVLHIVTPTHNGQSTSTFFKINSVNRDDLYPQARNAAKREANLRPPLNFILEDEFSLAGMRHFTAIDAAVKLGVRTHDRRRPNAPYMAGLHYIRSGDLNQLPCIGQDTVYVGAHAEQQGAAPSSPRLLVLAFNTAFFLTTQHRATAGDEDGQKLMRIWQLFSRTDQPDAATLRTEVEKVCDDLQARVCTDLTPLVDTGLKVVVMRNALRAAMARSLSASRAIQQRKRLAVWYSDDSLDGVSAKSLPWLQTVLTDPTQDAEKGVEAMGMFFKGCEYLFIDNDAQAVGRVNNNLCIGEELCIDPREPPDDPTKPYRLLRYMPKGMYVRPHKTNLTGAAAIGHGTPPGCIPLLPDCTATRSFRLPEYRTLREGTSPVNNVKVKRKGFPVRLAAAVTDYWAQGVSFKEDTWACDLRPPPSGGGIKRASVVVIPSRFKSYSRLHLTAPLWPEGDREARRKVVDAYMVAAQMDKNLRAELLRLRRLDVESRARYQDMYAALTAPLQM